MPYILFVVEEKAKEEKDNFLLESPEIGINANLYPPFAWIGLRITISI